MEPKEFASKMGELDELAWQRDQAILRGDIQASFANEELTKGVLMELQAGGVLDYVRAQRQLDALTAQQFERIGTPDFARLHDAVGAALRERDQIVPEEYWRACYAERRERELRLRAEAKAKQN